MSADTLLVILLVWAVAGLLAAIAFGKAIQGTDASRNEDEPLPHAAGAIKYFRNNKRKTDISQTNTERGRSASMKRTTG